MSPLHQHFRRDRQGLVGLDPRPLHRGARGLDRPIQYGEAQRCARRPHAGRVPRRAGKGRVTVQEIVRSPGPWRKLRPRSRAQNVMRFPVEALNGKYIPVSCEKTGHAFRSPTSGARVHFGAPSRVPSAQTFPPAFAPLYRPFGRLSARAGILKTILFLCNTMQVRPARFEGGRDGEDSRR